MTETWYAIVCTDKNGEIFFTDLDMMLRDTTKLVLFQRREDAELEQFILQEHFAGSTIYKKFSIEEITVGIDQF